LVLLLVPPKLRIGGLSFGVCLGLSSKLHLDLTHLGQPEFCADASRVDGVLRG